MAYTQFDEKRIEPQPNDSFLHAISGYSLGVTALFLTHNIIWIVAAFVAGIQIALRNPLSVHGGGGILTFGVVFLVLDIVLHLLRFIGHLYINTCYNHHHGGTYAPSSLNAYVRSKRMRPYVVKLMLSITLWTLFWKHYVYASTEIVLTPTGNPDLYGRYTALAFVLIYGAIEAAWAIQTATWYYLFQSNIGILTKRIVALPPRSVLEADLDRCKSR